MVAFNIICAFVDDFIIGIDNQLPWNCPEDLNYFRGMTLKAGKRDAMPVLEEERGESEIQLKNCLIMGYNTFVSMGKRYLPGRYTIVIDREEGLEADRLHEAFQRRVEHYKAKTLGGALAVLDKNFRANLYVDKAFIIGGEKLLTEFFTSYKYDYFIHHLYLTKIHPSFKRPELFAASAEARASGAHHFSRFPFQLAFQRKAKKKHIQLLDGVGAGGATFSEASSEAVGEAHESKYPSYLDCWKLQSAYKSEESGNEYRVYAGLDILGYEYVSDERAYLQLIYDVLQEGEESVDRTGVGTISKFGAQIRFSLRDGTLPLLTTKKMFTKGIILELLWFLRGETDSKILERDGVNIWKGNTSREYLNKLGLGNYAEGEGGPIYGHQFRGFGAKWNIDEGGHRQVLEGGDRGIDQVAEIIRLLKEEPHSRRILLSLWNPMDLPHMALPPCHLLYQFRVYNGKLKCSMYQRSCDTFLGLPFNICSTALMTYIFAHLTGLEADEIVISIGDAHIYKNHVDQVKEQLRRTPYAFPKVKIAQRGQEKVEDFVLGDFQILGYESHSAIRAEMAV